MAGFIVMGEEADRFLAEQADSIRKDFSENAEALGLDSKKDYDFICLSFEPNQAILPEISAKLLTWPAGPVRGYVNDFGNLCLNMPMTPGEDSPEEENIFEFLKKARQEYYDLESANWECYRADFQYPAQTIDDVISIWNASITEDK